MEVLKVLGTSLLSMAALLAITKLLGHKQMSQLDFLDYINGITIGSIAAELATELEEPLKPFLALTVYGAISFLLSTVTRKFPKTRKYVNGSPTILLKDGRLYRQNLKKAKLDLSEFMVLCREQGYFDLHVIHMAIFEHNGKLTILPVSANRPATPADLGLTPQQETIAVEVIMDGRILADNLQRMGIDETWLTKQVRSQGYQNCREVFLGVCDQEKNLSLFGFS